MKIEDTSVMTTFARKGSECAYQVEVGMYVMNPYTNEKKFVSFKNGQLGFDETHITASSSEEQKYLMQWAVNIAKELPQGDNKDFVVDVPGENGEDAMHLVIRIHSKKAKVAWKVRF